MNCEQFEDVLQQSEQGVALTTEMEAHLGVCLKCSEMVADIAWLRNAAFELRSEQNTEPPPRIWAHLRLQMLEEGLIREPQPARPLQTPAVGWRARLRSGIAYAGAFTVAMGAVYLFSIVSPQIPSPELNPRLANIPPPPVTPSDDLIDRLPPRQKEVFISNLNQVNSSIQELSSYYAAHPEDPFAREELFSTYQQKSRLWEDLIRWQEFPADTIVP